VEDLEALLLARMGMRCEPAAAGLEIGLDDDGVAACARRGLAEDDPLPAERVLEAVPRLDDLFSPLVSVVVRRLPWGRSSAALKIDLERG
jgi:hypothetical protein